MPTERIIRSNDFALAIADAFPVSPGHTLIIPRRHVTSFFELTSDELIAAYELLRWMRDRLDKELKPGGYNIGINVGAAAGQTVAHVHFHLMPRYAGDVDDPVGGVRNVLPGRGTYLRTGSLPMALRG